MQRSSLQQRQQEFSAEYASFAKNILRNAAQLPSDKELAHRQRILQSKILDKQVEELRNRNTLMQNSILENQLKLQEAKNRHAEIIRHESLVAQTPVPFSEASSSHHQIQVEVASVGCHVV